MTVLSPQGQSLPGNRVNKYRTYRVVSGVLDNNLGKEKKEV